MKWNQVVLLVAVVAFFSICIPASLGAYWCWANRKVDGTSKIIVRIGWVLGGMAWSYLSTLVATLFGVEGPRPHYSVGYVVVYVQGLMVLACAVTALVSYLQRGERH